MIYSWCPLQSRHWNNDVYILVTVNLEFLATLLFHFFTTFKDIPLTERIRQQHKMQIKFTAKTDDFSF